MTTTSALDVLLVEDNAVDARLVVELLRDASEGQVRVQHAPRLTDALASLEHRSYHALLLDLSLPDSEGIDTFRRARRGAPHVPIVVLTGTSDATVAAGAVRHGAQDYLVKGNTTGEELHRAIRYAVERHAFEAALRESEARYRSLVDGSIQGILIHQDGIVRLANPAFARLVGVNDARALVGTAIWHYIEPDDRARVIEYALARLAGEQVPSHYEFRARDVTGRLVWLDCLATVITWDDTPASLVTVVDVTARREAEAELHTSDARFRQVAENIKEGLVLAELPDLQPTFVNRAWADIWGYATDAEIALRTPWYEGIHADDRAALEAAQVAVAHGESVVHVFRVVQPGGDVRWVRARIFPVFAGTAVVRTVGLVEDITVLRETEEQLQQAQRMEAVGRLAGGIAHDFNNLLTAILGYTELVLSSLPPDDPSTGDIEQVKAASESAARLTSQLLAFSRRQILQPELIDLNDVVRRTEPLLRRLIGEDIDLQIRLASAGAPVRADAGQVEQAIMNLAVNARDALPDGGAVVIETAHVHLDDTFIGQGADTRSGPHAMLAVSDTGIGMDDEVRRRMFEPFFTTKETGKGTGLGLATVYGFVKQSQGAVTVESELGRGSTFRIFLPLSRRPGGAPAAPEPTTDAAHGDETILLVEDQAEVRAVVRETLQRAGYTVLQAATGAEALALASQYGARIHVLLTDVVMAGMTGRELAQRLREIRPEVRTMYMSGYTDDAIVRHGVLEAGMVLLQKPFSARRLRAKVRQVLDA